MGASLMQIRCESRWVFFLLHHLLVCKSLLYTVLVAIDSSLLDACHHHSDHTFRFRIAFRWFLVRRSVWRRSLAQPNSNCIVCQRTPYLATHDLLGHILICIYRNEDDKNARLRTRRRVANPQAIASSPLDKSVARSISMRISTIAYAKARSAFIF